MVKKKTPSTSRKNKKTVAVYGKHGDFISYVNLEKALRTVKRDKAIWTSNKSIKLLYEHDDIRKMKLEVHVRDKYRCYYCDKQMSASSPDLTVDHVMPLRLGGSILPKNMVCSCAGCNSQKGHRTYEQYFMALYGLLLAKTLSYNLVERRE